MELKSVKDLETLIKMLRKQNVDIIKLGDVEIVFGKDTTVRQKRTKTPKVNTTASIGAIDETTQIPIVPLDIPTDELTEEQILFGSSDPTVWETQQ